MSIIQVVYESILAKQDERASDYEQTKAENIR